MTDSIISGKRRFICFCEHVYLTLVLRFLDATSQSDPFTYTCINCTNICKYYKMALVLGYNNEKTTGWMWSASFYGTLRLRM